MKADKFVSKVEVIKDYKTFEVITKEIKDCPITQEQYQWIYEVIYNEDWENAQDHKFYQNDDWFTWFNVQETLDCMEDFKDEYIDDCGQEDWDEMYKHEYSLLYNMLIEYSGWDVNYE